MITASVGPVRAVSANDSNEWVFKVVQSGPSGKSVQIKWPIGTVTNVRLLDIPWEYRSLLLGAADGTQLVDNLNRDNRKNGYASIFAFSVVLPDVSPHTGRDPIEVANNRTGDIGQGLVCAGVNGANPSWNERREFRVTIEINTKFLYTGPERVDIPLVPRTPRFDLNRIGPERFVIARWRQGATMGGPIYKDMWFDGETPEDSDSVIICGSDERPMGRLIQRIAQTTFANTTSRWWR